MAIRLRFAMHGIRNHRILHLVAIDHRKARNAKPAELLGVFKPCIEGPQGKKSLEWSVDRIRYWLHVGAVPSKSVVGLLELVCAYKKYSELPLLTNSVGWYFGTWLTVPS